MTDLALASLQPIVPTLDFTMPVLARINLDEDFLEILATATPKQLAREWRVAVMHEVTARCRASRRLMDRAYEAEERAGLGCEWSVGLKAQAAAELARAEELSGFVSATLAAA